MSSAPLDLRELLDHLRSDGDLVEIDASVDPRLELPEIHRRVIAANGPALLFRNVVGSRLPVATNLFGTARRVERAFGDRPGELVERIAAIPDELIPPTPARLWKQRGLFGSLARIGLRHRRSGPITETVQRPPKLTELPATTSWPRDGGPFLTLPLVSTEPPDGGAPNLGMYRIQIHDDERTGLHMQIGKGGGFHLAEAERRGVPLPVNIQLGGPPAAILAAIAPLPENVPELLLASLALGQRLELCANPAGPLPLIARAEMALVGRVEPGERAPEGPFGDHYGYYSEQHDYPVFRCDALACRRDAILPATVVGKPRQEDFFLGDYLQELLGPVLPRVMPAVRSLWSYGETGYHSLSAAIVHDRYKREAMASAFRVLGEGQLSLTKFLLVLDDPSVDLRDFRAVLRHVLERADFRTDLYLFGHLSMDSLDYAGPRINEGSKGVLLGVGEPCRDLPAELGSTPESGIQTARVFVPGCVVVDGVAHADDPDWGQRVSRDPALAEWPLVVLSDDAERATRSSMNFLWTTFTRFDPAADLRGRNVTLVYSHPSHDPPVVLDARMKAPYPEELTCDPDTADRVDRRWEEYFDGRVEMGDSEKGHLD